MDSATDVERQLHEVARELGGELCHLKVPSTKERVYRIEPGPISIAIESDRGIPGLLISTSPAGYGPWFGVEHWRAVKESLHAWPHMTAREQAEWIGFHWRWICDFAKGGKAAVEELEQAVADLRDT